MKTSFTKKFMVSSILALALVLGSGCGQPGTLKAKSSASTLAPFSEVSYTETLVYGNYTCGTQDNIIPFDSAMGAGHLRACVSATSTEKVLVRGTTNYSNIICAFPYQFVDDTHLYLKPGANGLPMYSCKDITQGDGAEYEFKYTNFNGLYIVELSHLQQMVDCANHNTLVECDNVYSFGQFRTN